MSSTAAGDVESACEDLYYRCILKLSAEYAAAVAEEPGCRMALDIAIDEGMPSWRFTARLYGQSIQGLFVEKDFTGALIAWYKFLVGKWADALAAAKKGEVDEWGKAQRRN